ncbi:GFA family protein [Mameliella sediminis]|uniref:GFA family protein n=1 Tax=Mameliella sediminis TaxID=2836866 RepID=UPI001C43EE72|nr:GFA family protein [Mameliella sediminis]MBV7396162.1 GFA family protein [Mameliella sediminis]MBY6115060.1 GFA family protein [Antarctobacter heliothermus]MBY6145055.1 GFA family protein [Mameliella alba]MCA0955868.1 GFA family protein [Mameliella alba]
MTKGHCLCGAVTFQTDARPQGPSICHCGQCRRQSGHLWASAYVAKDALTITGPVRWFDSSPEAQRGFCPTCGSFLFWHAHAEGTISFALGALDTPTGITLEKHIFTADKGDYYDIADDIPQQD